PVLKEKYIEDLFSQEGVLTPVELHSRFEAYSEQYIQSIEVEAKLVVNMAKTIIYPAAMRHLSEVSLAVSNLGDIGIDLGKEGLTLVADLVKSMMASVAELSDLLTKHFSTPEEHMQFCANTLRPLMDKIRGYADALEGEVADDLWPLPTYQEMLFIK
ncbi:MAG: glutamine synthetase type III, partial [Cyanobacteria bacterium REEB459]|nr:glutamine synthetase type III [Cyanobacteria bacterium REEB459]